MHGYWGKLLRVDLTNRVCRTDDIPEETFDLLLGGSALGAKILLEETPAKVDPLSPENKLIFAVGPFQGVKFPGNGKWSVITKGPLTGTFLESAGTGHWAPYFKQCGFDAVVFEGRADRPVYLFIKDGGAEIRDAAFLWGKDTIETGELIKEDLGDRRINALNIGPAGERMHPIACISCDGHSFAGRGGAGAVMGSKNLKAVAAWGTREVPVHDPEKAAEFAKETFRLLSGQGEKFRAHGTPRVIVPLEGIGDTPIKYWRGDENKRGAALLGAPRYTEYLNVKPLPCINCPIGCHRHIRFEYPDGTVLEGNGPEYETIAMMGSNLLVEDLGAVAKANDRANRLGIDTISCGAWIGFLMECWEYGWITPQDTGGLSLKWGDPDVLLAMVEQIGTLTGMGAWFREGIRGAARHIGREAEKITVEVKNMDYPAHDPRAVYALGVNYAVGTRGACHERGNPQTSALGGYFPELGQEGPCDRQSPECAAKTAVIHQDVSVLMNCMTICQFMMGGGGLTLTEIRTAYRYLTGKDVPVEDLVKFGERAWQLQRIINVRDGLDRKDDTLPLKMAVPAMVGPRAGKTPTPHDRILDDYYELRGWDRNGVPTRERLEALGLGRFAAFLP